MSFTRSERPYGVDKPLGNVEVEPEVFGNRVLAAYAFNELSGPVARELVSGKVADLNPNTTYAAMWDDKGLDCASNNDNVVGPGLDIGSSFSCVFRGMAAWDSRALMANGSTTSNYSFMLYRNVTNGLMVYWNGGAGSYNTAVSIASVRDVGFSLSPSGALTIWIDELERSTTGVSMPGNTHPLHFFQRSVGDIPQSGKMEYAYFFDGEITKEEFNQIRGEPYSILKPSPVFSPAAVSPNHISNIPSLSATATINAPGATISESNDSSIPSLSATITIGAPTVTVSALEISQIPSLSATITIGAPNATVSDNAICQIPDLGILATIGAPTVTVNADFTSYINGQFDLSAGYIPTTKLVNGEFDLLAYELKIKPVSGSFDLFAYQTQQSAINGEFDLLAYLPKTTYINGQFDVYTFKEVVSFINGQYDVLAFKEFVKKVGGQFDLLAYQTYQSYVNGEFDLNAFKEAITGINGQYDVLAFKATQSYINGQFDLGAYQEITRLINAQYSIFTYVTVTTAINGEYDLNAFKTFIKPINAEYDLNAYQEAVSYIVGQFDLLANEAFYGWLMNLETKAMSRYEGFNFNSLSGDFGSMDDGIYELSGNTNNGTAINAFIQTGRMDFGTSNLKRVTDAYHDIKSDGQMKFTLTADGGSVDYVFTPGNEMNTHKINLARGVKDRYFQGKLSNVNGSDFELQMSELLEQKLSRKV